MKKKTWIFRRRIIL